ncbi:Filamin-B [Operophtera brumata]|uniref:Filamin-B n=1 Tax=Operophtera brumata TaxID=104452 RepID=A0A0L7KUQ3_OPEBR|nr:Filamin-B [Operophtera brumata]
MEGVRVTNQGLRAHSAEGSAGRITQAGLAARSTAGTAAKGMAIKGHEDLWVEIQANTFRNWVNETLKPVDIKVMDLVEDLRDGTVLCALVEALQGRRLKGWSPNPTNQHHKLENLILGLIWSLIVRYQIGRSKFPPRKLMLSWLQSALPECRVGNLTTDWNTGVLLSALVDHCKPGTFPHWRELTHRELDVPMVLEPEYLASPWLDELSGMTYLSYFMKPGSSGFKSTLEWVNSRLERGITNFTTDWNDGRVGNELVRSLGGPAPPASRLRRDPARWEENNQQAIDAAKKIGVQPVLSAKDMSSSEVEHLGTFIKVESISNELSVSDVKVSIVNPLEQESRLNVDSRGAGEFVPEHAGMHEILEFTSTEAPRRQDIDVTAHSPSGRAVPLEPRHPPPSAPGTTASSATFQPDEAGTWTIAITYKGDHIQLSQGALDGAEPLKPHSFELDTSGCGVKGDLQLDIVHDKRSVMCALEKLSATRYRATFMPKAPGKHRKPRDSSSPAPAYARISSPVTRLRSESPLNKYNLYDSSTTKHNTSSIDRRDERRDSSDYYKSSFGSDIKEKSYDIVDSAYSTSRANKKETMNTRYGSESPMNRTASPITTKHLGNGSRLDVNRSSSPFRASSPYRATSPAGRTSSPLTRKDSPLNRTTSPINR